MSENTLKTRLRTASKTEAQWKSQDPVALLGEKMYSTDTRQTKTGNGTLKWSELEYDVAIPASHSHSYAGSSSAGGSANSAVKLDTATAGSATQPVYFVSGKPTAVSYTIQSNVPANAKFTDTTYSLVTQSADGLMRYADKIKLDGIETGANKTVVDSVLSSTSTNPVQNKVINNALSGKLDKISADLNTAQVNSSNTVAIRPASTALASSPFARDLWHDHFAFFNGGHTIRNNQITTDGKTWVDDNTDLTGLFCEKETDSINILNASSLARRFTISGVVYSLIEWYEIAVSFEKTFSAFSVEIEGSDDESTWVKISEATIRSNSYPYFIKGSSINGSRYVRFTFTKTTNLTTGSVSLATIKGLTMRKGNQGLGKNYELPYDWDFKKNIYPYSNNDVTLGTYSKKWKTVYATTFDGAATYATKLQTYKQGSTTETYGTKYPLYAQWQDAKVVKLKCDNYTVKADSATTADNATKVNNHTVNADVPSGAKFTDTVYTHPTSTGNKHIPSGGSAGQILRWSADGTAVWGADNNTTYSDLKGATTSAAGTHGLVPAPAAGAATRYLRSDGTWAVPPDTNTTYSDMKGASTSAAGTHGLVPAPATGTANRYLRSDGTWQVPPDTDTKNTTGSTNTTSKIYLVGATSQAANPQTYSNVNAYVGTDSCLYSNAKRVKMEVYQTAEPTGLVEDDHWLQAY